MVVGAAQMSEDLKLAWAVANTAGERRVARKVLLDAVHFSGRNPTRKDMQVTDMLLGSSHGQDYCDKSGADTYTFDDFVKLCNSVWPAPPSLLTVPAAAHHVERAAQRV